MKKIIFKNIGLIVVFLLYVIFSLNSNTTIIPNVKNIFFEFIKAFFFNYNDFYLNVFSTLKIVILGFIISFIFGNFVAIICSMFDYIGSIILPIFDFLKNIPSIALFPVFIILMGIGDTPRIAIIVWNSIYAIISSAMLGLNSCDNDIIDAAKNCGANNFQIYKYIRIPLSVIHILNGIKISLGNGFVAVVVAEMLGATRGLGYMILWSANSFQYSQMFMYIIVVAFIGFIFNATIDIIIKIVESRLFYGKK